MDYSNYQFICLTPSTSDYMWVYLTDKIDIIRVKFQIIHENDYFCFKNGDYVLPFTMPKASVSNFYNRDLTDYVNPEYIAMGLDAYLIKFMLKPAFNGYDLVAYSYFIIKVKYAYIDGHILDVYADIQYEKYMNFKIYANMSDKKELISFVKANKKRINKLITIYANEQLKKVNLKINFYKLTNIMVTNDCVVVYQFSPKL